MISARRIGGQTELAKKIFARLVAVSAKVGWDDPINASKAYVNERGGISSSGDREVPPRPFIHPAIVKTVDGGAASTAFKRAFNQGDADGAYRNVGNILKENIQASIDAVRSPKLAQKTIIERLKKGPNHYVAGVDKPLIETGEMRESVKVKIEEVANA